jgi:hypothetical protein
MEELRRLAGGLREAVTAERFAQVQRIAIEYARLAVERSRTLAPGGPEAARLSSEALELLTWARQTTRARRASLAAQLDTLQPLVAYLRNRSLDQHS